MIFHGRAILLGDSVPSDGGLASHEFVKEQIYDEEFLAKHCMSEIDPTWVQKVRKGDVIVAGKRFACGSPHVQGFLALKGLQVACVVESIPRGSFRSAISAGVPILPRCPGVRSQFSEGDEIIVDFSTGTVRNCSSSREFHYQPLRETILEIIDAGGDTGYLKKLIATNPEKFGDRLQGLTGHGG
jgi:3-isopropylmalate/(R)-2-methylmalate dehydratase small subunit